MERKHFAVSAVIIVIAAGILLAMGQLFFCKCGVVSLWSGNIWSNQNSQQFTDPYTFTHILHGVLIYFFLWLIGDKRLSTGTRLIGAVCLESGWEMLENTDFVIQRYREATISLDYYGDSVFNSIGDILAMMLGFVLAWKLPPKVTAIGAVALDLALLLIIRDSLAINIIMLIHPIETIRNWQMRIN
jgi:hypothetical protein